MMKFTLALLLATVATSANAARYVEIEGSFTQLAARNGTWQPAATAIGTSTAPITFALKVEFPDEPVEALPVTGVVLFYRLGAFEISGGPALFVTYPLEWSVGDWLLQITDDNSTEHVSLSAGFTARPIDAAASAWSPADIGRIGFRGVQYTKFFIDPALLRFPAVPPPPPVPEPASWAMMIGGFALAGGAIRRRKVAVSSPEAQQRQIGASGLPKRLFVGQGHP